jgi:hypothetical protein
MCLRPPAILTRLTTTLDFVEKDAGKAQPGKASR